MQSALPEAHQRFLLSSLQAKTKGNKVNVGVKYAEKQERRFEPEKLREGRNIIGLQVWPLLHAGCSGLRGRQPRPWRL